MHGCHCDHYMHHGEKGTAAKINEHIIQSSLTDKVMHLTHVFRMHRRNARSFKPKKEDNFYFCIILIGIPKTCEI
jgi:hypothetical protein